MNCIKVWSGKMADTSHCACCIGHQTNTSCPHPVLTPWVDTLLKWHRNVVIGWHLLDISIVSREWHWMGSPNLGPKRGRLVLNGKSPGLFQIRFQYVWDQPKYTEIWSEKVPDLSHLGYSANLPHFWPKSNNPVVWDRLLTLHVNVLGSVDITLTLY